MRPSRTLLHRVVRTGVVAWLLMCGDTPSARDHDRTPSMGRPATERHHFQGDQFRRAGDPQCISPLAKPTESPHEFGYYVGGGARQRSHHADHRRAAEGVWGTDYRGIIIPKHVELGWWHGRRHQGGSGSYRVDGPRVLHRP